MSKIFVCGMLAFLTFLLSIDSSKAQRRFLHSDVAIVALQSRDIWNADALYRVSRVLEFGVATTVFDIQLDIIKKTAPFGPVLILAPDESTRGDIVRNCVSYGLCEMLADGKIRVEVASYETPWIRDYGPVVQEKDDGTVTVVDTAYHDVRSDDATRVMAEWVAEQRMAMILSNYSEDSLSDLFEYNTNEEFANSDLYLLGEMADILDSELLNGRRVLDDRVPFDIASIVLSEAEFEFLPTELYIDGGNLLKLSDNTCLTTRNLFIRNPGAQSALSNSLQTLFECENVIYLESLPGPVIKHVDMFLLPAGGNTVLLADYRLHEQHIENAWEAMSSNERDLTFQAAIAMEQNARMLRNNGYNVVYVPAIPPKGDESIYYPTMLNALVRVNAEEQQVLIPTYAGMYSKLQEDALDIIRRVFGDQVEIQTVESTIAAKQQGAVHCLTITVPFGPSVFNDLGASRMAEMMILRDRLDDLFVDIGNPVLNGTWQARLEGATGFANNELGLEVIFEDGGIIRLENFQKSISGSYSLSNTVTRKWPIEITLQDGEKISTEIEWLTDRSLRFPLQRDVLLLNKPVVLSNLDTSHRALEIGTQVNGRITESDILDENDKRVQAWAIEGGIEGEYTITLESEDFDPVMYLVGPGISEPIFDDDSGLSSFASQIRTTLAEIGTYKVVVSSFESDITGDFIITASPYDASSEPIDSSLEFGIDNFTDPDIIEFLDRLALNGREIGLNENRTGVLSTAESEIGPSQYPFQGWLLKDCQGSRVRVELASEEIDTVLIVTGPNIVGALVNDDAYDSNSDSAIDIECETGEYKVFVSSYSGSLGEYSIEIR